MEDEVPVLLAVALPRGGVLTVEIAAAAAQDLTGRPTFPAVEQLCRAACRDTSKACMTAFVAAFGHPKILFGNHQPFVSLIALAEFFATPRDQSDTQQATGLEMGRLPAASPPYLAARKIDACPADPILTALP